MSIVLISMHIEDELAATTFDITFDIVAKSKHSCALGLTQIFMY